MEEKKNFEILSKNIIRNLSNHLYEKRKATSLQIETIVKTYLSKNDSQLIFSIIKELFNLIENGNNFAKMGAITALGCISIALGSFTVAFFLDELMKPIFVLLKSTDTRVRYYTCESLYNIAKVSRGEILTYFNEIFDSLCLLVTDTDNLIKNAADILDKLIKDIIFINSTNNFPTLYKKEKNNNLESYLVDSNGDTFQLVHSQDPQKPFDLKNFILILKERMYTIDPFTKLFLISWLEFLGNITFLELITFLPEFLKGLLMFLMNDCLSDVRNETKKILNFFLKEIESIHTIKFEILMNKLNKKSEDSESNFFHHKDLVKNQTFDLSLNGQLSNLNLDTNELTFENQKEIKKQIEQSYLNQKKKLIADFFLFNDDDCISDGDKIIDKQVIHIDYEKLIESLLSFLNFQNESDPLLNSLKDEPYEVHLEIRFIVLNWIQNLLKFSPSSFFKFLPGCILILLENISISDEKNESELKKMLINFINDFQNLLIDLKQMKDLNIFKKITGTSFFFLSEELYDDFVTKKIMNTIKDILNFFLILDNILAKMVSLDWINFLCLEYSEYFYKFIDNEKDFFFEKFTSCLMNVNNEVVLKILDIFSKIFKHNQSFFKGFITKIVHLFEHKKKTDTLTSGNTKSKIEFIIKKICHFYDSEIVFKTLSEVLIKSDDLEFLNIMIINLNCIFLTAPELKTLRHKLRNIGLSNIETSSLFKTMFDCWCHNTSSLLSLCLLTSFYEITYFIITNLTEAEINLQFLSQLDIIIQLLESPIFLNLRLQLLEPAKYPCLYKSLYGLLMILPQSSTFALLDKRLKSIEGVFALKKNNLNTLDTTDNCSCSDHSLIKKNKSVNYFLNQLKKKSNKQKNLVII